MITFKKDNFRFVYRVVGVALYNDQVLLHIAGKNDFWSLPGGRGELLETAEDTLIREMKEELDEEIQVERLIWIVENFFTESDKSYHEIGLYFLMNFPAQSQIYRKNSFKRYEGKSVLRFKWHPLNTLEQLEIYPGFLKKSLKSIPEKIEHIVYRNFV